MKPLLLTIILGSGLIWTWPPADGYSAPSSKEERCLHQAHPEHNARRILGNIVMSDIRSDEGSNNHDQANRPKQPEKPLGEPIGPAIAVGLLFLTVILALLGIVLIMHRISFERNCNTKGVDSHDFKR